MPSSILGSRVVRKEDPKFLTGASTYVEDVELRGAAWAVFVRSPFAHARVLRFDPSEAVARGAQVFTARDVDLAPLEPGFSGVEKRMTRPLMAVDVVRHVGEIVAAVVADDRAAAIDAAELVAADYDPLPAVVDPEAALRGDVLLFPEVGTNVCAEWRPPAPDDDLFDGCDLVVRDRLVSQRLASCPLECRGAAAVWANDGRLHAWASTQNPHSARDTLARAFDLPPERVRFVAPDVGGGFGPKIGIGVEEILVPWLARRLGRPVRWAESRSENMLALGHGRAQLQEIELGGTRDGRVLAYRLRVVQDAGSYPEEGAILPGLTRMMATGVYAIPRLEFHGRSVVTNTTPTVAYRGAGRPEATQAIERAMDLFAAELGMDPAEVRRRNLIPRGAFPFSTPSGVTYDSGDYEAALDLLLERAGYEELRADQRRRREGPSPRQLGVGLSLYVEVTNPDAEPEWGAVEITSHGSALVRSGLSPHGQGHVTSLAMLVSDALGLPLEAIDVVHGDTDIVSKGVGTHGSRSLQAGGTAALRAAVDVVEQGRLLAAELLEANPADVVLDRGKGRFHVVGAPEPSRSWAELAAARDQRVAEGLPTLRAEMDFEPPGSTWPFGAHLAVVEVDTETGKVELVRMVTVDDSGRILNPLLAEGQRHGGIAQGAAQALLEEFVYDEDGNPLTTSLVDYAFPSAAELPSFELVPMETPTAVNELGAKGIGESGTIGATPAVLNAVLDALAPYGVRHLDMPVTPERVWRALAPSPRAR